MIIARVVAVLIGYVFGLCQTGYFYGKTQGIDIRKQGSGNAGTTNTLRVLGYKAGLITFIGDFSKAVLAILAVRMLFLFGWKGFEDSVMLLEFYAGFGAVLGHNFPFFLKFRGGKGIACTAGVIVALCPLAAIGCFIAFNLVLFISRYVSLSSIIMVTVFLIQVIVYNCLGILRVPENLVIEFDILTACFTIMAIWRHHANIGRLIHGTENKFSLKNKKEK